MKKKIEIDLVVAPDTEIEGKLMVFQSEDGLLYSGFLNHETVFFRVGPGASLKYEDRVALPEDWMIAKMAIQRGYEWDSKARIVLEARI